ncbi:DUF2818 family protein [Chromobacterium alticapitis]|uniref:DUF2818 domain-containing protein n=1 Tax=Chromobacterium alticapitis TaxID=2073169 RepID=A0A2S5DGF7_9NEIS|nr:DUF2818 family protein [Chromobacterium alticapitis]POZ62173.1 DUF2818 domain-containing protein [Chromobacterium alticapitis]
MDSSITILLLLAALAANLPFATNRVAGFIQVARKHFGWQALELVALYALIGGLAHLLETRDMPAQEQHWQFYVTTFALFLVAAFPGYVYRYFWRKPAH